MSLDNKQQLVPIAKELCREMRKHPTEAEGMFWEAVRRKQVMGKKFYRQFPIFHDVTGKETFFIADFYCHACRLIVEIDGRMHDYRLSDDAERTEVLRFLGLRVIRFKNEDVIGDLRRIMIELRRVLAEA